MGDGPAGHGIGALLGVGALFGALPASQVPGGHFDRRILQEPFGLLLRRQQGTDFPLQRLIARACVAQKRVALFGRAVQHRLQYAVNLLPSFGIHR